MTTGKKDVKDFIEKCDKHSFVDEDGISVISINKLKELAGDEFK